jgi:Domain of unknown function (DUF4159)
VKTSINHVVPLIAVALAAGMSDAAQRGFFRQPQVATANDHDGGFHYCRVMYGRNRYGDGGGWSTDFPDADVNLSVRLSELTKTRVSRDSAGEPRPLVVRLTDAALFQCPFIMMQEVGTIFIDDEEAESLREYLTKGGFLWVDDFWGSRAWDVWESQIIKVLPPGQFRNVDLENDHPIMRMQYQLKNGVPQVPSIGFWRGSGGGTSERYSDSAQVHARGILDATGRVLVLQTHNTDISDSWEREGEDTRYFYEFSLEGYAVAMNVLLYSMTH